MAEPDGSTLASAPLPDLPDELWTMLEPPKGAAQQINAQHGSNASLIRALDYNIRSSETRRKAILLWASFHGWPRLIDHVAERDPGLIQSSVGFRALYEATKKPQAEAFKALLDHGAPLDKTYDGTLFRAKDLARLVWRVSLPRNTELLQLVFRSAHLGKAALKNMAEKALIAVIKAGPCAERVQLLCSQGGATDLPRPTDVGAWVQCPVAVAILWDRREAFDQLLEYGADVDGIDVGGTRHTAWNRHAPVQQKPIFAAAKMMHRQGLYYAQRCVDAGLREAPYSTRLQTLHQPICIYLQSANFGTAETYPKDPTKASLYEAVRFWIRLEVEGPAEAVLDQATRFACAPGFLLPWMLRRGRHGVLRNADAFRAVRLVAEQGLPRDEIEVVRGLLAKALAGCICGVEEQARGVMEILEAHVMTSTKVRC